MAKSRFYGLVMLSAGLLVILGMGAASAGTIKLSGTHSSTEIESTCDREGGLFIVAPKTGGYGCVKGGNVVGCNSGGQCTGTCPNCAARRVPGGVKLNRPTAVLGQRGGERVFQ